MSTEIILAIVGFGTFTILAVLLYYFFRIRWEKKICKQKGLCLHCGEPLKFWQSKMTRFGDFFHADCAVVWDSTLGKKRYFSLIGGKVVCLNCEKDFDKSMKICPHCGVKK